MPEYKGSETRISKLCANSHLSCGNLEHAMLGRFETAKSKGADSVTRIAILDDYQNIALECADWATIPGEPEIVVFGEHIAAEDAVAEALADFDVVVAMRERTPMPASLIARLPKLRLLVTTGMRNLAIDMQAARARGVPVCGTALLPYAAFEHAWALILEHTKRIPQGDRLMREGGWQAGVSDGLEIRVDLALNVVTAQHRVAHRGQCEAARMVSVNEFRQRRRLRHDTEPAEGINLLIGSRDVIWNRLSTDTMGAITSCNVITIDTLFIALLLECHVG